MSQRSRKVTAGVTGVLLGAVLIVSMVGCNTEQIEKLRAGVNEANRDVQAASVIADELKAVHDAAVEQIEQMPDGPEKEALRKEADEYSADIQKWLKYKDIAAAQSAVLSAELDKAQDAVGVAQAVVNTAAPLIPPPYGPVIAVTAPVLLGMLGMFFGKKNGVQQGKQEGRQDAVNQARALEAVKSQDNTINFDDPQVKKTLDLLLGPSGKQIVDEAQGRLVR